jgi:hypothetical protein
MQMLWETEFAIEKQDITITNEINGSAIDQFLYYHLRFLARLVRYLLLYVNQH